MKKIWDTIIHKHSDYKYGTHYIYFFKISGNSGKNKKVKNKNTKKLFLTYIGLLKVLFSSRNETIGRFVERVTKTLFAAHLGTQDSKDKLASQLMGISADVVKEVFSKTSSSLPVVYLLSIGRVKDLRVTLGISSKYGDDEIVYKGVK